MRHLTAHGETLSIWFRKHLIWSTAVWLCVATVAPAQTPDSDSVPLKNWAPSAVPPQTRQPCRQSGPDDRPGLYCDLTLPDCGHATATFRVEQNRCLRTSRTGGPANPRLSDPSVELRHTLVSRLFSEFHGGDSRGPAGRIPLGFPDRPAGSHHARYGRPEFASWRNDQQCRGDRCRPGWRGSGLHHR